MSIYKKETEYGNGANPYQGSDVGRQALFYFWSLWKRREPRTRTTGINYLRVRLSAGGQWQYTLPPGYDIAWLSVQRGELHVADELISDELVVFGESEDVIEFTADKESEFVLGSAVAHPHELVPGHYSVHTSSEALRAGEERITQIGAQVGRVKQV
ncbi:cupin domain-containing protein [Paraburkholderia elongata]|uniref:Uncharacterized protein n=1 Tax=Paraburkholderia elongata TaxID=2675747 RepID=A0A972NVY2_9BURK|nr:hypothetical protein [Paraburkholderia elongata]NPT60866.1 hypothetical protein [Paraburkholderia elongata]